MKKQLYLSKSLYTQGLQCSKSLWLRKYKKDALTPPDESVKAIFETGNLVGGLACELFPQGKKLPFHGTSFEEKIALTKRWIDEGLQTIYEATFQYHGILVMVDILHKAADGSWAIYEVKSSTWNKKKTLKDIQSYIHDASIQYYVLNGIGLNVSQTSITLLNSAYTFHDQLKIEKLFTHVDVSNEVLELQDDIPTYLKMFNAYLSDTEHEPDIDIGEHCSKPYRCDAYNYCWMQQKRIPDYSVFDVFNMGKKPLGLYKSGLVNIEDIPDQAISTENQRLVIDAWLNKSVIIDRSAIQNFLDSLTYPIYHLDFETFQNAVPQFNKQRPYQQICFQYSLHIEHADGFLEHKEFLGNEGADPREEFIERMISDVPSGVTVLVYNENFEKTRIKELANEFPQYRGQLMAIHDCVVDLADPLRKKHYYDYRFKGKYSLKLVMPSLVPHMAGAYKKLNLVQNGSDAMNTFPKLTSMDKPVRIKYRKALLEYCKLDTLSMVEMLRNFKEMINQ